MCVLVNKDPCRGRDAGQRSGPKVGAELVGGGPISDLLFAPRPAGGGCFCVYREYVTQEQPTNIPPPPPPRHSHHRVPLKLENL